MSKLLLTRPEPGLSKSYDRLTALGHLVHPCPLQTIAPSREVVPAADVYVVTSPNAVACGLDKVSAYDTPIYAVGETTAAAVKAAGFGQVIIGDGHAQSLIPLIMENHRNDRIVHLSGQEITVDIALKLAEQGMEATRHICYAAIAVDRLCDKVISKLKQKEIDVALFYSARALSIFEEKLLALGMGAAIAPVRLLALSPRVAKAASLNWASVSVASKPTEEALISCL